VVWSVHSLVFVGGFGIVAPFFSMGSVDTGFSWCERADLLIKLNAKV